jgi:acetyl esterase/lipase
MLSFLIAVCGWVAAIFGVSIHLRDKDNPARTLQIGLNEIPYLPAGLGAFAFLFSLFTRRQRFSGLLGLAGLVLAALPFLQRRAADEDMNSAMRAGLGKHYEARIPPAMWRRLPRQSWAWADAFGARERAARARIWRDVQYAAPDGQPLRLDVYEPMVEPARGSLYPALVVMHPGGWREGDKGWWFEARHRRLAAQGYVIFDIQYRFAPAYRWPAQLDDVKAAIRWVRQNAARYQVDVNRIGLMGRSAGAQLAVMAALCPDADTQVQTVVSLYGPMNMAFENLAPDSFIPALMGGAYRDKPEAYASASPLAQVHAGMPPLLVVEGMRDTIVPPQHHGDPLANRMSFLDSVFVLLRVPWSRHGFDGVSFGLGAQATDYHIDRFLAWSLYGKE